MNGQQQQKGGKNTVLSNQAATRLNMAMIIKHNITTTAGVYQLIQ